MKRNLEAYQFALISEYFKLVEIIKMYPYLRRIVEEIKQNKAITLAVLFGSHAKKTATKSSDIDIFIETKNKKIRSKISNINSKISVKYQTGIYLIKSSSYLGSAKLLLKYKRLEEAISLLLQYVLLPTCSSV